MTHSIRRIGAALILLAKAQPSSASAMGRPNWARLYSSSFRFRGGASTEAVGAPVSSDTTNPFGHLPGIEVGIVMRSIIVTSFAFSSRVCVWLGRRRAHAFRARYSC